MGSRPDALYGIPISEIARLCGVSLKTARRWKAGSTCPPKTALSILSGDLGFLSEEWKGWRIRGSEIISPDGWGVSRNDALIVPLMHGQIAALRSELARAKAELEALQIEDQPLPEAWDMESMR
jgi:hypothetical protein